MTSNTNHKKDNLLICIKCQDDKNLENLPCGHSLCYKCLFQMDFSCFLMNCSICKKVYSLGESSFNKIPKLCNNHKDESLIKNNFQLNIDNSLNLNNNFDNQLRNKLKEILLEKKNDSLKNIEKLKIQQIRNVLTNTQNITKIIIKDYDENIKIVNNLDDDLTSNEKLINIENVQNNNTFIETFNKNDFDCKLIKNEKFYKNYDNSIKNNIYFTKINENIFYLFKKYDIPFKFDLFNYKNFNENNFLNLIILDKNFDGKSENLSILVEKNKSLYLKEILINFSNISKIFLKSFKNVGIIDIAYFCNSFLPSMKNIVELSFKDCKLTYEHCHHLSNLLENCTEIKNLEFFEIKTMENGLNQILTTTFKVAKNFTELSIIDCNLSVEQCLHLSNLFRNNSKITKINLSKNINMKSGFISICNELEHSKDTLQEIIFDECKLDEYQLIAVINLYRNCSKLVKIIIS